MTTPVDPGALRQHPEPVTHPPENEDSAPDVEDKLRRMHAITQQMADLDDERIELRDELTAELHGHRYFVDHDGNKRYGYVVEPEPIEVDLKELEKLVPRTVFDDVTVRKVNKDRFKRAIERGRIRPEVFVKVAHKKPATPHIRFGDPSQPIRGQD